MDHMQLFPFERNRYYLGKMLTSADFQAEQLYMNNKRRFLNKMMFGSGIVYGMSVFNLDDLSILVESGMAIDGLGREIVIDNSVVRKLSAIEGYDQITDKKVSLCVRYREEEVHPVYSAYQQEPGKEYENNRISESYELFLMNAGEQAEELHLETEFFIQEQLFQNEDYEITVTVPAAACRNHPVRVSVEITKHSAEERKLDFQGVLQLPASMEGEAGEEIFMEGTEIFLQKGEKKILYYWAFVNGAGPEETSIIEKPDTVHIWIDGAQQEREQALQLKVRLKQEDPRSLIQKEISRTSLEMLELGEKSGYVRLAEFDMVNTQTACIIDKVHEEQEKKYIFAPSKIPELEHCLSWFQKEAKKGWGMEPGNEAGGQAKEPERRKKARMAKGTLELPLDMNMRKGDICYSPEIVHGLGNGMVYVDIGVEFLEEKSGQEENTRTTVYGDVSLFEKQNPNADHISTAVKVFQDKGTFQAAVKLLGEQKSVMLVLDWFAIRLSDRESSREEQGGEQGIMPKTPTAVMGTRESYYFGVRFLNMQPCSLIYEMTEEGSGEISQDGMYTAPGQEGIYEIRISCPDHPKLTAYAYAVVKKKHEI